MIIAALFTITKTWKQFRCPSTDKWKEVMVHIYNGILLSHKKDKIMLFAVIWMQVGIVIFSEIRQKGKDKYHMILFIYET